MVASTGSCLDHQARLVYRPPVAIRQGANADQVRERLRKDIERLGSQKALAEAIGIGAPYLSDVLKGNRDPGPSILKFYGLREESVYVSDGEAVS